MPQRQHPSRDTGATYYKTDLVLVAVGQRFKALAVRLALPPNRAQPSAVLRRHISPAKQRALGAGVARARSATAEEPGRCSTSDAQAARLSPRKGLRQRQPCTGARAFADTRGALTCISSPSYTSSPRPSFATNLPLPSGTPCGVCGHGQRRCRGADTARTPHAALRPRSRTPRRPRPCVSHLEECADVRVLPGLEGTLAMHLP